MADVKMDVFGAGSPTAANPPAANGHVQLVPSQKRRHGGFGFIATWNGYIYHCDYQREGSSGARVYWKCTQRGGCGARIITDKEGRILNSRNNFHSHEPVEEGGEFSSPISEIKLNNLKSDCPTANGHNGMELSSPLGSSPLKPMTLAMGEEGAVSGAPQFVGSSSPSPLSNENLLNSVVNGLVASMNAAAFAHHPELLAAVVAANALGGNLQTSSSAAPTNAPPMDAIAPLQIPPNNMSSHNGTAAAQSLSGQTEMSPVGSSAPLSGSSTSTDGPPPKRSPNSAAITPTATTSAPTSASTNISASSIEDALLQRVDQSDSALWQQMFEKERFRLVLAQERARFQQIEAQIQQERELFELRRQCEEQRLRQEQARADFEQRRLRRANGDDD